MSMEKYYTPTEWENYPSEDTAINAMRLNHAEDGINELDDRIVELSTDKSEVDWNQILLSGEKIAEITINGIKKDVYTSNDSAKAEAQAYKAEGYATGEQNGIPVESGSPYYQNNSKYFSEESASHAEESSGFADDAEEEALVSEGWAVGEQNGVPVPSTSPYYHNNSKYWSQQSNPTRLASLTDVDFGTLKDDEIIVYDATSQKWKNEVGVSADLKSNTTGQFNTRTGGKLESCVINIEPKQSGSGTPSPSNVRPIIGHSSVKVWEHGKNLIPMTLDGIKSLNTGGTWSGNVCVLYGVTFTVLTDNDGNVIGIKANGTATATFRFVCGILDVTQGQKILGCPPYGSDSSFSITTNSNIGNDFGNGFNASASANNCQIQIRLYNSYQANNLIFKPMVTNDQSVTYATFAPYQGQDITINLGGTYYGGTLDVVSGVLTVDKGYADLGSLTWTAQVTSVSGKNRFRSADITSVDKKPSANNVIAEIISSNYKAITAENTYFLNDEGIALDTAGAVFVYDSTKDTLTAEQFKTAVTGYKLVYELATPLTIQLTPQQINTLIGENHLDVTLEGQSLDSAVYRELFAWDDVNDVVNTRLPISAIGTDESNNDAASQAYSQGDYFYKNGIAKAKTSIASGATFTLGTNYEIKTLAEILKALES